MKDNTDFNYICDIIRQTRKKYGITQENIADLLGIEVSSINRFESYSDSINWEELVLICTLFNLDLKTIIQDFDLTQNN